VATAPNISYVEGNNTSIDEFGTCPASHFGAVTDLSNYISLDRLLGLDAESGGLGLYVTETPKAPEDNQDDQPQSQPANQLQTGTPAGEGLPANDAKKQDEIPRFVSKAINVGLGLLVFAGSQQHR
jgi:hypothetical protein